MKADLSGQIHELMERGLRPVTMVDIQNRAPVRVTRLQRAAARSRLGHGRLILAGTAVVAACVALAVAARRPRAYPHGWGQWLAPLAAAAAVTAVIAGSVAISGAFHARPPKHQNRTSAAAALASVPPYYVTLTGRYGNGPTGAVVRATATGKVLATVTPPKGYRGGFTWVSAAANDCEFVLSATARAGWVGPTRFFWLHISPATHTVRLKALGIPSEPVSGEIMGIALSPDGGELAVALNDAAGHGSGPQIQVFNLAAGSERVWSWPGGDPITASNGQGRVLSWASGGRTLAFQQSGVNSIGIRLLDVTTPGGSLQADSRLAVQWPQSPIPVDGDGRVAGASVLDSPTALLTPDGSRIVAATVRESQLTGGLPGTTKLAFTEYSAHNGKVVAVLDPLSLRHSWPGSEQLVLWANASGSTLIVVAHQPGAGMRRDGMFPTVIGVVHGSTFTPLPGAPSTVPAPTW